jgi:nucleoside phosphorylase
MVTDARLVYAEVPNSMKDEIKERISLLIITATDIETKILQGKMRPLTGYTNIAKMYLGNCTYYVGCFGVYGVVHVQCGSMGSISRDASLATAMEAIEIWKPKAVVMVGIAFGVSNNKQYIGDVLVSESIIPYNIQRVGENRVIYRNPIPPSGGVLLDRLRNFKEWDYKLPCGKRARIIHCQMLSGESLVDNPDYRDELLNAFPAAKGGEMEGVGLYAAADRKKTEWIIVKGICDFADGNKAKNKDEYQTIAAKSAISFCQKVFSSRFAFDELHFVPIDETNQDTTKNFALEENPLVVNKVLFDRYTKEMEDYYIERDNDHEIEKWLDICGLWISGPSGCGKTCSISRNLIQAGKRYIYVNLGCCIGYTVEKLFNQIYLDVIEYVEEKGNNCESHSTLPAITKSLSNILGNHFKEEEIYIFIEEIPLDEDEPFAEFVSKISPMMIDVLDKNPGIDVKFIFSSIKSPQKYIASSQKKICEKIKFLDFQFWKDDEIMKLLEVVVDQLNIHFSMNEMKTILTKSKGSPRFVKMFTRNYICLIKNPGRDLDSILNETFRELDY